MCTFFRHTDAARLLLAHGSKTQGPMGSCIVVASSDTRQPIKLLLMFRFRILVQGLADAVIICSPLRLAFILIPEDLEPQRKPNSTGSPPALNP